MTSAKNFVTQELAKEGKFSKADQIDILNKSLDFLRIKMNLILTILPMKL